MIIDFEHHIFIKDQVLPGNSPSGKICERYWDENGKLGIKLYEGATEIDRYLKFMDDAGIDKAVLTTNLINGLETMKKWNNFCAATVKEHPDRFIGYAVIPPLDGKPALDELDRAVNDLGMTGVHIWTRNGGGRHLDDRGMWPFYAKAAELKLPIDVHVTVVPTGFDAMESTYGLSYIFAREFDMAIATMRVCLGGILEDFPDLIFIMNHFGGGISSVIERLDAYMDFLGEGWESFYEGEPLISRPWREYYNKLYFNIGGREKGLESLKCALTNISPKHLVFGTDWPFNYDYHPEKVREYAEDIRRAGLPEGAAEDILGNTAAKILGLK
ncbi:amidohydrolase family protein [Chloroflexota bacterium]